MAAADLVITGTVLTVDDVRPTAEALAIADGRIVAVGGRAEVGDLIGRDTETIDVGGGCVLPVFVEAHGHPLMEAMALSDRIVDIRLLVEQLRDQLTVRLRTYEISNPQMATDASPGDGDDTLRQVGIKIWVDGSPWIGNIDSTFPYLDTAATHTIGVTPGSCGHANYTRAELAEIVGAYFPLGWPMACHVQGDAGVDTILDVYEEALRRNPRDDHRLRLEHVGAIRPDQLQRAADLGVTCSIFVDQIHYWGDVIVDGLFGPVRGARWMPADPRTVPPEQIADLEVRATFLAGRQVYRR